MGVVTDGRSNTSMDLNVFTMHGRFLLLGQLSTPYYTTNVFLEIEGGNVKFDYGTTKCQVTPSSLMSHIGPITGSMCTPYCGVPSKCHYVGIMETRGDIATHHFTCQCTHRTRCKELVLWIWPESLHRNPRICEIRIFPWFGWDDWTLRVWTCDLDLETNYVVSIEISWWTGQAAVQYWWPTIIAATINGNWKEEISISTFLNWKKRHCYVRNVVLLKQGKTHWSCKDICCNLCTYMKTMYSLTNLLKC